MRRSPPIDALFPRIRQAILAATLMHPDRWWYLSDLAKHLGVSPSSLQRELSKLTLAGILRRRPDGNRVYYQPDSECPVLAELKGIVIKTVGLVDLIRSVLEPFRDRIDVAFLHGSIARGEERSTSDIDLITVGDAGLADLSPALQQAESRLKRPINATVYTRAEFAKKAAGGNHFLRAVLDREKLFVVGDEHDLEQTALRPPRRAAQDKRAGTRRPRSRRRP